MLSVHNVENQSAVDPAVTHMDLACPTESGCFERNVSFSGPSTSGHVRY